MLHDVTFSIWWTVIFSVAGGAVGIIMVLLGSLLLPRLVERLTPDMDEEKEITRGNVAVAEYFGRIVATAILGMSLIVAAAVLGGIIAAAH